MNKDDTSRLEEKVDRLLVMAERFFYEMLTFRSDQQALEERITALERSTRDTDRIRHTDG